MARGASRYRPHRRDAHRPGADRFDTRGGFALIEVMLALMLIAVLAALALPGPARRTGPAALRIAAFEISALLRQDRNIAQITGRLVATHVDMGNRLIVSGASSASVGLPSGATVRVIDAASPNIRFFADGRSTGGVILLASADARYAVFVNRDSGAIRVGEP